MGHDRLGNHFKTNFSLMQHHKWSLSDMDALIPWERYIYVELLQEFLKEEEKKAKDRELELKAQMKSANRRKM
jgi:hypothetical protein